MMPVATFNVEIGTLDVQEVLRIETSSALAAAVDSAVLHVDNAAGDLEPEIAEGMSVRVELGYQGMSLIPVFSGAITSVQRGRVLRIECQDGGRHLRKPIVRAWRNVSPADLARDIGTELGMEFVTPAAEGLRVRSHWVSPGTSAADTLREAARVWGLDWALYCDWDRIYWGPWGKAERAAGNRALSFVAPRDFFAWEPAPAGGRGTWVSNAAPILAHSQVCMVVDEAFGDGIAMVRLDRVTHILDSVGTTDAPSYRTEVEWTRLA